MIEGKPELPPILDPFGGLGIGPGARGERPRQQGKVSDADGVPARVAARVRIDPHETQLADFDAGLLEHLAPAGRLDRLAEIDESAGKRVAALERLVLAPNEEHASLPVINDAIGRKRG